MTFCRRIPPIYEPILSRVERPGRYVGGEVNAVVKDPAGLRASMLLAFPDLYDLGMSYHGFRILYERINAHPDFASERVFTPWPDYADALREAGLPLTSLETFRPLRDFEIIGFTLQHELCYTNVLEMLDLGGVPLKAGERSDSDPVVLGGGEGAYAPEPMAEFFDAFLLGDGEEAVLDILEAVASAREAGLSRLDLLRRLAGVEGVYVPSLYEAEYEQDGRIRRVSPIDPAAPEKVRSRVYDISEGRDALRPVVPLIRTVQDRTVVEIRRGCVHGCRFCHAGMTNRPIRERPVEQVVETVREALKNTGDRAVSLLSLSAGDYTQIQPLLARLNEEFASERISVSLPSLRISTFDVALARQISTVRKSGFTFAPEAGSERLRRIINKPLDEGDFLDVIEAVLKAGWRTIKFYFMIGLPGETDEDLMGIVRLTERALERAKAIGSRNVGVNITLSPFVPKPHTPFQWEGQITLAEIRRRMGLVRDSLPRKGVEVKTSPLESSFLEGVFARGDRRLSRAIETAWRNGCRFDAWRETFRFGGWLDAFRECGLDPEWYACRPRPDDEVFPHDHLVSGTGRRFLERQRDLARQAEVTHECVEGPCPGCEACGKPKAHRLAKEVAEMRGPDGTPPASERDQTPVMRVRLRFTKSDALRFIAHLDLVEAILRLIRRSGAPVAHTQGFNPLPRVALSPPLPLGVEGRGELADVLLLERIDPGEWLERLRSLSAPAGLEWIGVEEVGLKAPSLQQSIGEYGYEIVWSRRGEGGEASVLPLGFDSLRGTVQEFLAALEWPIHIDRKGKTQDRDARAYVTSMEAIESEEGLGLRLRVKSDNGMTLGPFVILAGLFGEDLSRGVHLSVCRLPVEA
ncbi:TIGR03960 family B12-binding radical SAM protein [bacterium]|nr:TIGR03960 family B12-binding radical SAM protein [bacterium]